MKTDVTFKTSYHMDLKSWQHLPCSNTDSSLKKIVFWFKTILLDLCSVTCWSRYSMFKHTFLQYVPSLCYLIFYIVSMEPGFPVIFLNNLNTRVLHTSESFLIIVFLFVCFSFGSCRRSSTSISLKIACYLTENNLIENRWKSIQW